MPNITTERLEKILDEKLNPLSEQLKEALATVKTLNTKIEQMEDTFGTLLSPQLTLASLLIRRSLSMKV